MKLKTIIALVIISSIAIGCKKENIPVKMNDKITFRGYHLSSLSVDVENEELQKELDAVVLEIQESIKYSKWESEEWVSVNNDIEELEKTLAETTNIDEREDLIDTIRLLNDHKDEEEFDLIRDNHAIKKKYNAVWDKIDQMNEMKKNTYL